MALNNYRDWIFLLCIAGFGMMLANFVGFSVGFGESLPGVAVLVVISLIAVLCDKVIPLKLPVIAYASVVGLLLSCPISPIAGFVIESTSAINFTAPLTMVGAFAGMSISNQLRQFIKQGPKMVLVTLLVMTGTYIGSICVAQVVLMLTGAI